MDAVTAQKTDYGYIYSVPSETMAGKRYSVRYIAKKDEWFCNCRSFLLHGNNPCKHILKVRSTK